MPHSKCLGCKSRVYTTESEAEPIGDLWPVCGLLLESVGDLGEIVGSPGVIETRGGASHSGCSSAGQLLIWAGSRGHRWPRTQARTSAARSRTLRRAVYELTRTSRSLALPPRATRP